jgi:hypothetical protein
VPRRGANTSSAPADRLAVPVRGKYYCAFENRIANARARVDCFLIKLSRRFLEQYERAEKLRHPQVRDGRCDITNYCSGCPLVAL